jgi:hypothetical protein
MTPQERKEKTKTLAVLRAKRDAFSQESDRALHLMNEEMKALEIELGTRLVPQEEPDGSVQ